MALIGCSFVAAVGVYLFTDHVLSSFLITDAGIKSDDAQMQGRLDSATIGLQACRDLGLALAVGCFACAVAVSIRLFRARAL